MMIDENGRQKLLTLDEYISIKKIPKAHKRGMQAYMDSVFPTIKVATFEDWSDKYLKNY